MKKLFLLRHAQAMSQSGSGNDKDRKLTPGGIADARTLGHIMKQKNYHPDLVLCSTAERTRETLEAIEESLEIISTLYINKLYEGGQSEIFHAMQKTDDNVKALMIVAHNPSIHSIASILAKEDSPGPVEKLSMGYAPGTLSVFSCPCERWAEIQPGANMLIDLLEPARR